MSNFIEKQVIAGLLLVAFFFDVNAGNSFPKISEKPIPSYFPVIQNGQSTNLLVDDKDFTVVKIASGLFSEDVERIIGIKPAVTNKIGKKTENLIIVGTIGKSQWIDKLIAKKKIDLSSIENKWESFIVTTVENPLPNVKRALVIAGSDRRGAAYGVMSLSEAIGVSPWYWWADVNPQKKKEIFVQSGTYRRGSPSVKYRGIFINDERFGGWAQWAAKTFDTELKQVGPKTYEKVFELLLRLKANYLWPAMHDGTKAFNYYPENAKLADDYGIVMGSSHCEQMLRNNEGEWKKAGTYGDFNYGTNRETIVKYWEERVKANGKYENTYTLGLRGIHDYVMEGAKTLEEQVEYTQKAIADQRNLLKKYVNTDLTKVPQVLCAYKEVLSIYQNGLNLPDDVTLLWADDNHGFIRQLSNLQEQKRAGGAGVYYHLSYHGDPDSWLWLSSISPSLIAYEMTKAYEYGADRIWVFNVGDIKPAEKELTFAMEMAWDITRWNPLNAHEFIGYWAAKTFGAETAKEISLIMNEYYRLAAAGKEHHVRWVDYSEQNIIDRIAAYNIIRIRAERLAEKIPARLQDAYYELVLYPVKGAALMNEYLLYARKSLVYAAQLKGNEALQSTECSKNAYRQLNEITDKYNKEILNGKWDNFFNWRPYNQLKDTIYDLETATPTLIEQAKKLPAPQFIDVSSKRFNADKSFSYEFECSVSADSVPIWFQTTTPIRDKSFAPKDNVFCRLKVNEKTVDGIATPIGNIWHALNIGPLWNKVGVFDLKKGRNVITISDLNSETTIHAIFIGLQPPFVLQPRKRVSAKKIVVKNDIRSANIEYIPGLGYGEAISVLPFTMPSLPDSRIDEAPWVEYSLYLKEGDNNIEIRTLPTQRIHDGRGVRYAVSINNSEPEIISIQSNEFSAEWQRNVLRGYATNTVTYKAAKSGDYNIRIYFPDAGVVLQEILIR